MGAIADRAQETTNTTGTGTLTLAGAVSKYQALSAAFPTARYIEYGIESGIDWEVTYGYYDPAGSGSVTREKVRRSSNSGNAINVSAGAKVWSDLSADNFTSSVQPFRNRIYNGAWRFDQVKEGSAYSINGVGPIQAVDGWSGSSTGTGVFSMTRVTDPDDAGLYALKVACTTADASIASTDNYYFYHVLEGYDVADLKIGTANAAQITISFDMKFDVAGVYGISLINSGSNWSYTGTVTQNVGGANESKVLTLTLDPSHSSSFTNGEGLRLRFCLAAGSNFQTAGGAWVNFNTFTTSAQANFMSANTNVGYIKRIQLEKGLVATPFEETSYAADLARTELHAEKSYPQGTACGSASAPGYTTTAYDGTFSTCQGFRFRTAKRGTPSMTGWTNNTGTVGQWRDSLIDAQTVTFSSISANAVSFLSVGAGTSMGFGHWYANARLS